MTDSKIRRSGRLFYLNRGYGREDMDVHSLGRNQIKTYPFMLLTNECLQYKGFGRLG